LLEIRSKSRIFSPILAKGHTMKIALSLISLIFFTLFSCNTSNPDISVAELKEHVYFLASDDLEGRKPGTKGGRIAADYIRDELDSYGLTLLANDGFQEFTVVAARTYGPNNSLSFDTLTAKLGTDFAPVSFTKNTEVTAPVVFADYGFNISTDEIQWDSYADIDVTGKWVMVLRGDPEINNQHSAFGMHGGLRNKAVLAADNNAAGLLVVNAESFDKRDRLIEAREFLRQDKVEIPVVHVTRKTADFILAGKATIAALAATAEKDRKPLSVSVEKPLTIATEITDENANTRNVIAKLSAPEATKAEGAILIGAHYDHLGYGGKGSGSRRPDTTAIHNGADDNASGVAAVLELAEKLSADKDQLKRDYIFMFFGAEEMGLLGSKFFTKNPEFAIEDINLMINLDMIGRMDTEEPRMTLGGTGTAIGLDSLLKSLSADKPFAVKHSAEGFGPSDHASFYVKDVPVLFLFTGTNQDYHTPEDDAEFINYEGQQLVTEFAFDIARFVERMPQRLVFSEAGPKEQPGMMRRFKVTFGIMPDYANTEVKGLRLDAVRKGGPADKGGLQKGDVITSINGKPVNNIYDYMFRLGELKSGDRANVDAIRNGKNEIFIIEL
jgi:aminopeptidase YwaD